MNTKTYYLRHQWHSERFIFAPAARRVMDYIIENSTSYPRWVDGCFLPPGCISTPRSRVCNDLGISLRDLVGAINTLGLYRHVRNHSYDSDILYVALLLDPDEITPPPVAETSSTTEHTSVGPQSIAPAPAQPEVSYPKSESTPEVGAQYIAPAQPEPTHPQSQATHEAAPQSIALHKKAPLAHPLRRCAIHCGRPGTTSFKSPPPPAHSKTSVALDRPTPTKNFCLSVELQRQPPIRGAPHSTP